MLYQLTFEKTHEHEQDVTSCDYNSLLKIIATCDELGYIWIWNFNKKFLREIRLPDHIDSICFINPEGDLLVSHSKRISLIKYEKYYSNTFELDTE